MHGEINGISELARGCLLSGWCCAFALSAILSTSNYDMVDDLFGVHRTSDQVNSNATKIL